MTETPSDGRPTSEPRDWHKLGQRLLGRLRKLAPLGFGVLVTLMAILLYSALASEPDRISIDEIEDTVARALASATPPRAISAQVYQTILPSLVIIRTQEANSGQEEGFGIGSGVIINNNASVLTALHVVKDAKKLEVVFTDGTQTLAVISRRQTVNNIAVLTPATQPDVFTAATIGNALEMRISDEVFAVGNPLGLAGSMSAGVISGLDRTFTLADSNQKLEGVIQFDAAVNPGNSGGPLLNRYGQVGGIVTGLVNKTDQEFFVGIGFAVPISEAARAAGWPAQ